MYREKLIHIRVEVALAPWAVCERITSVSGKDFAWSSRWSRDMSWGLLFDHLALGTCDARGRWSVQLKIHQPGEGAEIHVTKPVVPE